MLIADVLRRYAIRSYCTGTFSRFNITGNLRERGPTVGAFAECEHAFSGADVSAFAAVTGDNNPIHLDETFAAATPFGAPIVHGMLVGSVFSTIFARCLTGSIYIKQSFDFRAPVYVGSIVKARVEVVDARTRSTNKCYITCSTTATLQDGNVAVSGEAKCLVPLRRES